jgi:hypothetical protein
MDSESTTTYVTVKQMSPNDEEVVTQDSGVGTGVGNDEIRSAGGENPLAGPAHNGTVPGTSPRPPPDIGTKERAYQQELELAKQKIGEKDELIDTLQKVIDEGEKKASEEKANLLKGHADRMAELQTEVDEAIGDLQTKVKERDEKIDRLQAKVTTAAIKSTEMGTNSSPLQLPENEVLKVWHAFNYLVRNFVMNHLDNVKQSKMASWAKDQAHRLKDVTPDYAFFAEERKYKGWLIEAAIWDTLVRLVFGEPGSGGSLMCWAGNYGRRMFKLSKF